MDVDDGELLRLIGEGDREAFDVLYARNAPWLVLRPRPGLIKAIRPPASTPGVPACAAMTSRSDG
jgi:hypothetical protein